MARGSSLANLHLGFEQVAPLTKAKLLTSRALKHGESKSEGSIRFGAREKVKLKNPRVAR